MHSLCGYKYVNKDVWLFISQIKMTIKNNSSWCLINLQVTVPVNIQLEISPQHHLFVIGRNGINIKQIMQCTGASVHFPDPSNMTQQRKSTVFITGNLDSVCVAREMIIVSVWFSLSAVEYQLVLVIVFQAMRLL